MYADDLKIFKTVTTPDDCNLIQSDIDNIQEWAQLNKMSLNVSKCLVVTYSSCLTQIKHNYLISGSSLQRSSQFKDLGVIFDSKLSFKPHIFENVKNSFKILGCVTRTCHFFKNTTTCHVLYNSLVRTKLEYASVVWSPTLTTHSDEIEKVQKRFLRYMYFKKHDVYPHYHHHPVSSFEIRKEFGCQTLKTRRNLFDCLFIYKLINNIILSSNLLELIYFRTNVKNTRNQVTFAIDTINNNSPLTRILKIYNLLPPTVDPFYMSLATYINLTKEVFNV